MKLTWDLDQLVDFGNRIGNTETFETYLMTATQEIAKALHKALLTRTPVVTGNLRSGWSRGDNLAFRVQQVRNGYMVELSNDIEYARWVNYGHHSYNQFGGPYEVKNRTVKYYQGGNGKTFVYGHFFVEKSILDTEPKVEKIIRQELKDWLRWCVNGK
jgi:hypothetical protein